MSTAQTDASDRYTSDAYVQAHPDWHLADAPGKVEDLLPASLAVAGAVSGDRLRIADVGAGVGGVLDSLDKRLKASVPSLETELTAYEFASAAVERGRELFPGIDFRHQLLTPADGPHDVTYLVDVLEHVENPWELLRTCHAVAPYVVVRQPLLDNLARFRHNDYKGQRDTWGHISYFNVRSFHDLMLTCGWRPLHVRLLAPWELSNGRPLKMWSVKQRLTDWKRETASFLIDGFYLVGAFARNADADRSTGKKSGPT